MSEYETQEPKRRSKAYVVFKILFILALTQLIIWSLIFLGYCNSVKWRPFNNEAAFIGLILVYMIFCLVAMTIVFGILMAKKRRGNL